MTNGKADISVLDNAFKEASSGQYILSVLIGLNRFSYTILDEQNKKYIGFTHFALSDIIDFFSLKPVLEALLKKEKLLQLKYKSIKIGIVHNKCTLIPDTLFDEKSLKKYLDFNHQAANNEALRADNIPSIKSKIAYVVEKNILQLLEKQFAKAKIYHASSGLLESLLQENTKNYSNKFYVNIEGNNMEVIVIKEGKLSFHNWFTFQSPEDFIYYVLFVCEQLRLDAAFINLVFLGDILQVWTLHDIACNYVKKVDFDSKPKAFYYSAKFSSLPRHAHYNLFCLGSVRK